jgi:hypothetical protein
MQNRFTPKPFSFVLALLLFLGIALPSQAIQISVGVRAGYEASLNLHWPGDDLYFNQEGVSMKWQKVPVSSNFTMGFFADFRLFSWFSISPAFNFSTPRRTEMKLYKDGKQESKRMQMGHETYDLELLAKFHIKWWYVAVGTGISINSEPHFTQIERGRRANYDPNGNIPKTALSGLTFVVDTGFYFPIANSEKHHILLGWRTTVVTNSFSTLSQMLAETNNTSLSTKAFGISPVYSSLAVGYVHRF